MFYVEYMFYVLGGLLGIFENYGAYQRWVQTTFYEQSFSKRCLKCVK